ncbi:hypothetical protein CR205_02270 [Alteribacter lacisalsi]|uniref:Uncharacterized protein n=2 Tax=Alteribacter lacisalsi TaxID=2045244 RepID=A0A2W0HIX9_9BACI|nr:hypothetical protein CR205_02270 [Alteribacter lacisalsi]
MERIKIKNGLDFFGYHLCEEALSRGIEVSIEEEGELTEEQEMMKALFVRNSLFTFGGEEANVTLVNGYERAGTAAGDDILAGREEGDILLPPLYGPFQPKNRGFAALLSSCEEDTRLFRECAEKEGNGLIHARDGAKAVLDLLEKEERPLARITGPDRKLWNDGVLYLADRFEKLEWCRDLIQGEADDKGNGGVKETGRLPDEQEAYSGEKRTIIQVSGRPVKKGLAEQLAWMEKTGL